MKHVIPAMLVIFLFFGASFADGNGLEEPYSLDYLMNPQEYLHVIGSDPANPPSNLPIATEVLLNRSNGGVILHWSRELNYASDINLHVPVPEGVDDVKTLLTELSGMYGFSNFDQEFELHADNRDIQMGSADIMPHVDLIVFQHVCRFAETTIPVAGSQVIARIETESRNLIRLSSTYRPVECTSPSALLSTSQVGSMFPGAHDIGLYFLAAGTYQDVNTSMYTYRFETETQYYEINASTGAIIRTRSNALHSHGVKRSVKNGSSGDLKCTDSNVASTSNSTPANTTTCTPEYKDVYDSLHWSVKIFNGVSLLNSAYKKKKSTELPNWGDGKTEIRFSYYTIQHGASDLDLGRYDSGKITQYRWIAPRPGATMIPRKQNDNNQPLPGMGAALDVIAHEVGHGYLEAILSKRGARNIGSTTFGNKVAGYKIGIAITEAFCDIFGKVAEGWARYENAGCTPTTSTASCGAYTGQTCGSSTSICRRGEYCSGNTCLPCVDECSQNTTQETKATMDWKFGHTYYKDGQHIFKQGTNGYKHFRDLSWQFSDIKCPHENNSDLTQLYLNSLFFSRLLALYGSTTDSLHGIPGYIRHRGDLEATEAILRETIAHMPAVPNKRTAERAWLATVPDLIKNMASRSKFFHPDKIGRMVLQAVFLRQAHSQPVQGRCQTNCDSASDNICEKN